MDITRHFWSRSVSFATETDELVPFESAYHRKAARGAFFEKVWAGDDETSVPEPTRPALGLHGPHSILDRNVFSQKQRSLESSLFVGG
jgi:hypothetical protein